MSSPETWVGWVDEPHEGRGTFGIISTCLTTIFLCTWTAVHHDVPRAGQPAHITFLKKIAFMAGAVLAPELVTAWSLYQYLRAKSLTAWMTRQHIPWTIDHSFCLIMGGFTYDFSSRPAPRSLPRIRTLTVSNVESVVRHGRADFAAITKEQVMDKSKADGLAKALACLQAFYLAVQVLGRACQHLPVTSLEVSTVGYVPWTLLSYYFWWNKPFNVNIPTQIHHRLASDAGSTTAVVLQDSLDLQKEDIWDIGSPETRRHWTVVWTFFIIAITFGGLHVALWNAPIFATRVERYLWRATSLGMMIIPVLEGILISALAAGNITRVQSTFFNPSARSSELSPRLKKHIERFRILLGVWGELVLPLFFFVVRLCIIVEIFYGLHSLPKEAYADVNWAKFVPHASLI